MLVRVSMLFLMIRVMLVLMVARLRVRGTSVNTKLHSLNLRTLLSFEVHVEIAQI